jgi:hypothetical protein
VGRFLHRFLARPILEQVPSLANTTNPIPVLVLPTVVDLPALPLDALVPRQARAALGSGVEELKVGADGHHQLMALPFLITHLPHRAHAPVPIKPLILRTRNTGLGVELEMKAWGAFTPPINQDLVIVALLLHHALTLLQRQDEPIQANAAISGWIVEAVGGADYLPALSVHKDIPCIALTSSIHEHLVA